MKPRQALDGRIGEASDTHPCARLRLRRPYLSSQPAAGHLAATRSDWYRSLANYEKPDTRKAVWQLVNTLVPYAGMWALMGTMINRGLPYWSILPPALLAA